MAPTLSRRMSAEDAAFLYFERPNAPLHIGSVGIYEGEVSFDKMIASIDARMHLIPRYRQRAVIPPLYAGHPTWEDDPNFSIERHIKLAHLPSPGTRGQLIAMASDMFAEMLPRDRPLWDITMIHGLEDGTTAYLSRVHHCLVDGVSGIELLLAVLDLVPNPDPTPPPAEPWDPKPVPSAMESWGDAVFEQWSNNLRAIGEWQQDLLSPQTQVRRFTEIGRALEQALPMAFRRPAQMPWNKAVGSKRRAGFSDMSFQEVRGIRSALGGTVNDVVLTVLGGALGRYLRSHGINPEGQAVRVMIPVNVRSEDQKGALGNRVSMMLPNVPVGITDPVDRLKAVREEMERLKTGSQANAFEELRRLGENLPAVFHALAGMNGMPQGQTNLVCTNVPGPLIPLYSVGHRMLAHYPMVPLAGDLGIGVGVTSFDKGLFIGVMADPEILDDVDLISRSIDEEMRALRTMAGVDETDLPAIGLPSRNGHANGAVPADAHATAATS